MDKIARLLLVVAIGISLLFGTFGCAEEITEPAETPTPVTTPEPEPAPARKMTIAEMMAANLRR